MALLRLVTDPDRGTSSERKLIIKLLKSGVPPITIFHDLYIEKSNGHYAQIDAVVVTSVGIIVFEVKDYKGWIFGKGYQKYWTQVLSYGRQKYRFYNPVMQNAGHIEALRKYLAGIADVPMYSAIIFFGRCSFRDISYIPDSVCIGYASDLNNMMYEITASGSQAYYKDKRGVINKLRSAVARGDDEEVVDRHIRNVRRYQ